MNKVPKTMMISVVDDDESVRSGVASLLRAAGYVADTFGSAEEFLNSGDPRRFACVVADIHMPGMSGIELANRLGHNEPPTPVILVTGRAEREVLADAVASGAACTLHKPFGADQLLQCVLAATH
jgi:FixJ family two-component response regulator